MPISTRSLHFLPRLAKNRHYAAIQDYHPAEGPLWARTAVADWLKPVAGDGDPGRVVLTIGAQHALDCVLSAVTQKSDVILADEVTYQGINALCRSHGLDLRGLAMDKGGLRPDAFDAACAQWRPRAVFLVPSLHNPTTITLSEERRRDIVEIARRHNVLIIEDDVYRPLLNNSPPSFANSRTGTDGLYRRIFQMRGTGIEVWLCHRPAIHDGAGGGGAPDQLLER